MSGLATQEITHDRGLGSAYERYCFYQLVDAWRTRYEIETALEGPIDGMAGVSGVHCVGLARRGVKVTTALPTESKAESARVVYKRSAPAADVDVRVVTNPMDARDLPPSDLVIAYHSLPLVDDWRAYLKTLAGLAKKLLVVTVCNPDNWGVAVIRTIGRMRGITGLEPPAVWHKETLAPALWELGRVREHVYFDAPWWPDLQVSAGQSLLDRAKQLFKQRKKNVAFTAVEEGAKLAESFVYGPECWPYFGDDNWADELMPALLRHPGFDGTKMKASHRVAHLHGFVVDMRPRTPQARRRLAQV